MKLYKILSKRMQSIENEKNFQKPWAGPRRKFFGIHLYREVGSMPCYGFFDDEERLKQRKKDFHGPDHQEWEEKIKKVCPWQFWFRHEFLYKLERYCNFITFYPSADMSLDSSEWTLFQRLKCMDWDYENYIVKAIDNWRITQIKDRLNPHNIIKIKTLPRTYCDASEILLHAQMQIVTDFMERNPRKPEDYPVEFHEGNDGVQIDVNESWRKWTEEAWTIYNWWKNYEVKNEEVSDKSLEVYRQHKADKLSTEDWLEQSRKIEQDWKDEITDMLCRVAKIRDGFWD